MLTVLDDSKHPSGRRQTKSIIEIKNEHIYNEATRSVQKHGWLLGLFRNIIQKAKKILQVLIRETELPPKPTLSVDMAEYRKMQKLMVKVQDEARAIKHLKHTELPKLEKQLAEITGLFKGKERKALTEKIERMRHEIDRRMDRLPGILKEDGYPDVQVFKRTYDAATALVEQYNRELAAWKQEAGGKGKPKPQQSKLPEKESIRKKLRDMEAEAKRRNDARRRRSCTAAMTMTEDAKTEKYTAGNFCGAYIKMPCKFEACRAYSCNNVHLAIRRIILRLSVP